ncbi:MAG: fumarylacetoacetate hydrolase family protein [Candidatus Dormiibacterota bacterium]
MRVTGLITEHGPRLAIRRPEGWAILTDGDAPRSVSELVTGGERARIRAERAATVGRLATHLGTNGLCVPLPGKLLCVGMNYRRHAAEIGLTPTSTPTLFSKFNNALVASGSPVTLPADVREYDYEAELGVVIGRRARRVSEAEALDHVWGYCNCNDLSARDLQFRTSQYLLGKMLDGFLPVGPELVSADEVDDPQNLTIRSWLNGELRQDSTTSDMLFSVRALVSYISQYVTLEPGDFIATGTPEGVIQGRDPKVWMKPGDVVEVEVQGLGRLVTPLTGAH